MKVSVFIVLLFSFYSYSQDTLDLSSSKVCWNIHSCSIDSAAIDGLNSFLDKLNISKYKKVSLYFEETYSSDSEQIFVKCRGESLKAHIESNLSLQLTELITKAQFVNKESMNEMITNGTRRKMYLIVSKGLIGKNRMRYRINLMSALTSSYCYFATLEEING